MASVNPEPTVSKLELGICNAGRVASNDVRPWNVSWDELNDIISKPVIGTKDGDYFTRCAFQNDIRNNDNVLPGFLAILDGDKKIDLTTGEISNGAPDPAEVHEVLSDLDIQHAIYSSFSNDPAEDYFRYRVIVPVPVQNKFELEAVTAWLCKAIQDNGIGLVDVDENKNFPLPWHFPRTANEDTKAAFYYARHDSTKPFPKAESLDWWKAEQAQSDTAASIDKEKTEAPADSLIEKFNATYGADKIVKMLTHSGYRLERQIIQNNHPAFRLEAPNSTSGTAGVHVFMGDKGKYVVYSHHGDHDPLSGKAWDAFDIFRIFQHNGDQNDALSAYRTRQMLEIEKGYPDIKSALAALESNPSDTDCFKVLMRHLYRSNDALLKARARLQVKQITGVNLSEIDAAIKQAGVEISFAAAGMGSEDSSKTHSELAGDYLEGISEPVAPVAAYGKVWAYDPESGVWAERTISKITSDIGKLFRDQNLCKKAADYRAIAGLVYDSVSNENYFQDGPRGIAVNSGFITIEDGKLVKLEHQSANRARFKIEVEPEDTDPETLIRVLREGFGNYYPDEQLRQIRMMAGLAVMGLQMTEQLAVLMFGAGNSGKSLLLSLLEKLFPREAVAAVSPSKMDEDYSKAQLAGKLLNAVPELEYDKPIHSAGFKAITGGDLINARAIYSVPFTYRAECANWFVSNHLMTTRDHSDGFWRRWSILHFTVSKPQPERDTSLDITIAKNELGKILGWALRGLQDYLDNGLYFSPAHYEQLEIWKRQFNSVASWLHDKSCNGIAFGDKPNQFIHVSAAYSIYKRWCTQSERKPVSSQNFKMLMAQSGFLTTLRNGYNSFNGIIEKRFELESAYSFLD